MPATCSHQPPPATRLLPSIPRDFYHNLHTHSSLSPRRAPFPIGALHALEHPVCRDRLYNPVQPHTQKKMSNYYSRGDLPAGASQLRTLGLPQYQTQQQQPPPPASQSQSQSQSHSQSHSQLQSQSTPQEQQHPQQAQQPSPPTPPPQSHPQAQLHDLSTFAAHLDPAA
jgi:hypothetical protein